MKLLLRIFLFLLLSSQSLYPFFNIVKPSATLRVKSGANFVVENQVNNFKGNLVKEAGGSISGGDIVFEDGVFDDGGNKIKLRGNLNVQTTNKICLTGNQIYKGKRGAILQDLEISGSANRLEGVLQLKNDITLQDQSTSVTYAANGRMPRNIIMNGGKVYLEEDLHFVDDMFFTGSGTIALNKRNLHLGSKEMTCNASLYFDCAQDVEMHANLNLGAVWTFSGQSMLEGNGDVLSLASEGGIVVEKGSSLLLKNVEIRSVSSDKLRCLDNASTVSLQNVRLVQDEDYTFACGSLHVLGNVDIQGGHKFIYQSSQTSTIWEHARLRFGPNTTFSYDAGIASKELLCFQNSDAVLAFNNATLYTTVTGFQLKRGTLEIKGDTLFCSERENGPFDPEQEPWEIDEGIMLGGEASEEDCVCKISPGSRLYVGQGMLAYNNKNAASFQAYNYTSELHVNAASRFKLYEDLELGQGCLYLHKGSTLLKKTGKAHNGATYVLGTVATGFFDD